MDGAPFVNWQLPDAMLRIKDPDMKGQGGDRAFVDLLMLAQEHGIETVAAAGDLAVEQNALRLPAILTVINQRGELIRVPLAQNSDYPRLTMRPQANPCPAVHCKMHESGKRHEAAVGMP